MTNYEKIKNMTVEEIRDFILYKTGCNMCTKPKNCGGKMDKCRIGIFDWLKLSDESEVENYER